MSAEWAAVLIAAIGLAYAIGRQGLKWFVTRAESARARLQVTTTRWMPNGLRLQFCYSPEFTHSALRMQVTIKTAGVRLIPGRPVLNPAPMLDGGHIRWEFDGQCIYGSGLVKLILTENADALTGVMFLLPDGSGEYVLREAQIEIRVSDGSRRTLLRRTYMVSPVRENPNTVFVALPAIRPIVLT